MNARVVVVVVAVAIGAAHFSDCKVFSRCELARDLHYKYKFSRKIVPSILCMVKFGSNYNTAAESIEFLDGSRSHGLFQVRTYVNMTIILLNVT